MKTIKRVLVLSSGPPMSQKVLYCLDKMAVEADLLDIGIPSIAKYSRYRRKYATFDLRVGGRTLDHLSEFLRSYSYNNKIDAVIASDIAASGALFAVKGALSGVVVYPVSSADTLDLLDNKWRFQKFMEENAIPCPAAILLEDLDEIDSPALRDVAFPLVVKPLFGESSHGVVVVQNFEELNRHLRSGGRHAKPPLLLQQFARGFDADLSLLAISGEVIGYVLQSRKNPHSFDFISHEGVLDSAKRIVKEVGYSGVANIDFRVDETNGRAVVLECNPRFWYTLSASLWRGINFVDMGLRAVQGLETPVKTVVGGSYLRHADLLRRELWKVSNWSRIEGYNLRGLFQVVSDPLPFLYDRIR